MAPRFCAAPGCSQTTVDGMVDTRAVSLVLPHDVVERLGLDQQGTAVVTYADERQDERPVAGPVTMRIAAVNTRIDNILLADRKG